MSAYSEKLSKWFGLSYASFAVLPRIMMQDMSQEWQDKMADLLEEYETAFPNQDHLPSAHVSARTNGNKYCRWPDWLLHYRNPDRYQLDKVRGYSK